MSFIRQINAHPSYQVGVGKDIKNSIGRVAVIPNILPKIGYPKPIQQEKHTSVSNLERKK